jgi:hypothetical protein
MASLSPLYTIAKNNEWKIVQILYFKYGFSLGLSQQGILVAHQNAAKPPHCRSLGNESMFGKAMCLILNLSRTTGSREVIISDTTCL